MSDTDLRACPFCGCEAMLDEIIAQRDKDSDKHLVICTVCLNQTNHYLYKDDAIEAWNTRHQPNIYKCGKELTELDAKLEKAIPYIRNRIDRARCMCDVIGAQCFKCEGRELLEDIDCE